MTDPQRRPVDGRRGDYRVTASTAAWTPGRHYKIFGNLIVPSGKSLDIRNSLVEIVSDYPHQHVILIRRIALDGRHADRRHRAGGRVRADHR